MKTFLQKQGMYDEYLLIGEFNSPDIFLKFYDPTQICQNKCRVANLQDIDDQKNQLIAMSAQSWKNSSLLPLAIQQTILYPNGQPAYYIATNIPQ